jgi:hypothetical protein
MHRDEFLIIKPTRCTNFSNLFLEWDSTCFGQFICLLSGVYHCTHSNGICHTGLLTACEQFLWQKLQNITLGGEKMWLWLTNKCNKFDVHVAVHHDKFLTIKPTRCINFSNLFLEWNSTCFRQFLWPSSGDYHCTHSNGICHTGLLTACEQDKDGTAVPSLSYSQAHRGTVRNM